MTAVLSNVPRVGERHTLATGNADAAALSQTPKVSLELTPGARLLAEVCPRFVPNAQRPTPTDLVLPPLHPTVGTLCGGTKSRAVSHMSPLDREAGPLVSRGKR